MHGHRRLDRLGVLLARPRWAPSLGGVAPDGIQEFTSDRLELLVTEHRHGGLTDIDNADPRCGPHNRWWTNTHGHDPPDGPIDQLHQMQMELRSVQPDVKLLCIWFAESTGSKHWSGHGSAARAEGQMAGGRGDDRDVDGHGHGRGRDAAAAAHRESAQHYEGIVRLSPSVHVPTFVRNA